jgi:DNA-binding MarR family transcriptional regulator
MELQKENLAFLLADVSRLIRRSFQKRIEGSSLTQAQARALIWVSKNEGMQQCELAELLEIQPITLARLIDQLEQSKLVERRPNPTDRRAYQLYITKQAAPHLAAIREVSAAIRADALLGVEKNELAILLSTLQKIRNNLGSH